MQRRRFGEAAAVVAVAAIVRGPITSIPPQVHSLTGHLHMGNSAFGLLTTIPLLCFGLAAPLPISNFAKRYSPDAAVVLALGLLTLALGLRVLGGVTGLFIGTAVVGISIGVLNVMAPAIIRRDFHKQITIMTPVYTSVLGIMASAGAWLSIPLSELTTHDWRGGTAPWAILSALALLVWLPALRRTEHDRAAARADAQPLRLLFRNRTAWFVTLHMSIQSMVFYSCVAWVPKIMQDWGHSESSAGSLLGYTTMVGFAFTVIVPFAVGRSHDQRLSVAITAILPAIGYAGLAIGHGAWVLLFLTLAGVGHAAIAPALVLIGLRAPTVAQTAQLSAMAQGIGYGLAAFVPVLLGNLHDVTRSWTAPLLVLVAVNVAQFWFGMKAARIRD